MKKPAIWTRNGHLSSPRSKPRTRNLGPATASTTRSCKSCSGRQPVPTSSTPRKRKRSNSLRRRGSPPGAPVKAGAPGFFRKAFFPFTGRSASKGGKMKILSSASGWKLISSLFRLKNKRTLPKGCLTCQRLPQPGQVLRARDFFGPQPGGVLGNHLDIEELKAALFQPVYGKCQGHLGGVGPAAEHRLAGKQAANRHAIEPAGQLPVPVNFQAVGPAEIVQFLIGLDHVGHDPSPFI